MEFNNLSLCLKLWGSVMVLSAVFAFVRHARLKREHLVKKLYMQRFLQFSNKGQSVSMLLKELYYSFMKEKRIRSILLKSMNLEPGKALDYVYTKYGCEPMKLLHDCLLTGQSINVSKDISPISKENSDYIQEQIRKWDEEYVQLELMCKKRKITVYLEIIVLSIINYFVYLRLQTDISFMFFAFVATLGTILDVVLDNECVAVDLKSHDGKLAWLKCQKKTHAPARGLQNLFHLVCGMGFIINIFTAVAGWLGPVA